MKTIKIASLTDLPAIARCHQKAFPKALSSAMGVSYLCKMLEWYLVDERAFLFFIEEGSKCAGYCGGLKFDGSSRIGSASSMIQHSFREAVKTFLKRPWLFVHPEFMPKYKLAARNVFKRVRKIFKKPSQQPAVAGDLTLPEPHTGLIVIGVDPAFQGKGYGSRLLNEFEVVSIALGFHKLSLTVKTGNTNAIKSYLRNGWVTTEVKGKSTTMKKSLS